jgi:RHS repeat-associated protein
VRIAASKDWPLPLSSLRETPPAPRTPRSLHPPRSPRPLPLSRPRQRPCSLIGHRFSGGPASRHPFIPVIAFQRDSNPTHPSCAPNGSTPIDLAVLRDRDTTASWASSTTTDERIYDRQNWRADVSVLTKSDDQPIEWIKYSAYGVPTSYALADFDRDGDIDAADDTAFYAAVGGGPGNPDVDFDGDSGTDYDLDAFDESHAAASTGGRGVQSRSATANRAGYAGYQWDPVVKLNHVRHRVYNPEMGRWTRRDPLGYVDRMSTYKYSINNPLFHTDPLGLACSPNSPPPPPTSDDCGDSLIVTCSSDSRFGAFIFEQIANLHARGCPPSVKCDDCASPGVTNPNDGGGSNICINTKRRLIPDLPNDSPFQPSPPDPCAALAHELVHAEQICDRHEDGDANCESTPTDCLHSELEAYALTDAWCSIASDRAACLCRSACDSCRQHFQPDRPSMDDTKCMDTCLEIVEHYVNMTYIGRRRSKNMIGSVVFAEH